MEILAAFLGLGLVLSIAAFIVVREAGRIAREPPPALFDLDDALDWVVEHVPDDVAATLTVEDVRRILELHVEHFQSKGVAGNGSSPHVPGPVVVGGAETVDYIVERAADTGEPYLPEQVYGVLRTLLSYLRTIGAVGPPASGSAGAE
jgi:hypothetical protein